MMTKAEIAKRVNAAVETGELMGDTARALLRWIGEDGRVTAPNERAATLAREVLEAVGVEFRLVKGPNLPATPGETKAPDADRGETSERSGASKPATRSAAARNRSAAAWARKHPIEAVTMLAHHRVVMDDLLAEDAAGIPEGVELREVLEYLAVNEDADRAPRAITDHVFRLASRLPSTTVGSDAEPLSLLAAARESLGADQRGEGMLPSTPRVRVIETPEDRNRLPEVLPDPSLEERQRILPTLQAAADRRPGVSPAPWLQVFDRLGGSSMEAGRGAPLALRLWVEALAMAPSAARRGRLVDVELEVRDLVKALWPDGWNRGKQLPRLRDACAAINGLGWFADSEGRTEWAPVLFRRRPGVAATLNDPVLLQVQLPPVKGGGAGARFNRETLRRLGLRSAPAYRLYLGLVAEWDRLGRRGVPPTWPGFGKAERRRLIFGDDPSNRSTLRTRQADADQAFEALEALGAIALKRDPEDPRIFVPERRDLD
ncbi:MAG: hypothetical protein OXH70_07900 [Acidobacteria bacterium]|nr:hypothetical protein [Acidobacteriota bacterium]MCY3931626.1 hypothetical protein [Acidobacteriota bacterium]